MANWRVNESAAVTIRAARMAASCERARLETDGLVAHRVAVQDVADRDDDASGEEHLVGVDRPFHEIAASTELLDLTPLYSDGVCGGCRDSNLRTV